MKRTFQILVSLCVGGAFLWLAFRNVPWSAMVEDWRHMSYGWILPFLAISLFSHYLRTERWRMLIEKEGVRQNRSVLFAGVMLNYVVNYAIPRAGEVSRCVYVGRKQKQPVSSLIGSVVVERVIDLVSLMLLFGIVAIYLITDPALLRQLFGENTVTWIHHAFTLRHLGETLLWLAGFAVLVWLGYRFIQYLARTNRFVAAFEARITGFTRLFWEGLTSIRRIQNWPLFLLLTALIWVCYVLMSYVPFYMFNMVSHFHLSLLDALTLTVIAAIGVVIPSPGGMGTYHWFVKQTLWVLFAVPPTTGLAYAFVTYFVTFFMFLITAPLAMLWARWRHPEEATVRLRQLIGR